MVWRSPLGSAEPDNGHLTSSEASHGGWAFSSHTAPISGFSELLCLGRRLADPYAAGDVQSHPFCVHGASRSLKPCMCGSALVMGIRMHMPDAIWGANHVSLAHEASGLTVSFTAEGALLHWARDSVEHGSRDLRVPVANAAVWQERLRAAQKDASLDYDWTFRCDGYAGDVEVRPRSGARGWARKHEKQASLAMLGSLAPAVQPLSSGASDAVGGGGAAPVASPHCGECHPAPLALHLTLTPTPTPSPTRALTLALTLAPAPGDGLAADGVAGRLLRQRGAILWSADVLLYEAAGLGRLVVEQWRS